MKKKQKQFKMVKRRESMSLKYWYRDYRWLLPARANLKKFEKPSVAVQKDVVKRVATCANDEKACEDFLVAFGRMIFIICAKRHSMLQAAIHVSDASDVPEIIPFEDMFQETVMYCMIAARKYDPNNLTKASPVTYLFRAAWHGAGRATSKYKWLNRLYIITTERLHKHRDGLRFFSSPLENIPEHKIVKDVEDRADYLSMVVETEEYVATLRQYARLGQRTKAILCRRMQGETLQDIANTYKITRERIRQIEAKGLTMLRRAVESKIDLS